MLAAFCGDITQQAAATFKNSVVLSVRQADNEG